MPAGNKCYIQKAYAGNTNTVQACFSCAKELKGSRRCTQQHINVPTTLLVLHPIAVAAFPCSTKLHDGQHSEVPLVFPAVPSMPRNSRESKNDPHKQPSCSHHLLCFPAVPSMPRNSRESKNDLHKQPSCSHHLLCYP
jgi:hypothetical protein